MAQFNQTAKLWEGAKVSYPFPMDTFFGEEMLRRLKETPERVCQVSVEDNYELTCGELRSKSIRVAQNLSKLGIQSNDVIGIICRHSHELTIALHGCVYIGAPVNPLDLSFTKNDIKHLFGQTKPKLVICDSDQVAKVNEALKELGNDSEIYSIPYGENPEGNFGELLKPTGEEEEFVAPKFDERADEKVLAILCSSGTTGLPKGVMLSHAYLFTWITITVTSPIDASRTISLSPFFWGSGFFPHVFVAFKTFDRRIVAREGFSVEYFTKIVRNHHPTELTVPPMNLTLLLQSKFPEMVDHECLKLIICVGSIVSQHLRQTFSEKFPEKNLVVYYGMTEAGAVCGTRPGEYTEKLTVGSMFAPNVALKIVDEDGQKLGCNERGELCIKSNLKFLGYYNNPEATKNAVDDEGFFKSGDVGYLDESGKLFVIDRKKEIVKCRGYHVNLSEIESLIESIEGVKFVSVVGIPDPVYVTSPAAVIVKKSGFETLTEKFIEDFVASQFPIYKHLAAGVHFVDQLPTTPSGKIKKNLVSEIVQSRVSQQMLR